MSRFRYFSYELVTGDLRDVLPFTSAKWSDVLNKPGGLDVTIPRHHPKATRTNLEPGATGIYIDDAGQLVGGGILWTPRSSQEQTDVRIGGQGFFSYYREGRRAIRSRDGMTFATGANALEVTFTGIDVFDIVADLIAHAATFDGDLGFDEVRFHGPGTDGASDIFKTRTYWTYELKGIGDAIEELATQSPGFDFAVTVGWIGDTPARYLDLFAPRRGVEEGPTLIAGKNAVITDWTLDASKLAQVVTATGAGIGDAMLATTSSDTDLIAPAGPYPRLERAVSYRDESVLDNLEAHAAADLALLKRPGETLRARVTEGIDAALTSFNTGDTAYVEADDGFVQVAGNYRIIDKTVTVDAEGHPNIDVGLADEAATLGLA